MLTDRFDPRGGLQALRRKLIVQSGLERKVSALGRGNRSHGSSEEEVFRKLWVESVVANGEPASDDAPAQELYDRGLAPEFDLLPMDGTFATLEQAQIIKQYLGYIDKLEAGKVGRLRPTDGETLQAVRRRLGVAARLSKKTLEIRQMQDEVYFWLRLDLNRGRQKGRKIAANGDP